MRYSTPIEVLRPSYSQTHKGDFTINTSKDETINTSKDETSINTSKDETSIDALPPLPPRPSFAHPASHGAPPASHGAPLSNPEIPNVPLETPSTQPLRATQVLPVPDPPAPIVVRAQKLKAPELEPGVSGVVQPTRMTSVFQLDSAMGGQDKCVVCSKMVYASEKLSADNRYTDHRTSYVESPR